MHPVGNELAGLEPSATRPKFARVFETVAKVRQDLRARRR